MARFPILGKVIVGLLAAGIAAAFLIRPTQPQLHACGHPRDLLWEINPFRATHCCSSGRTVAELVTLYYAQGMYLHDHGRYATSFEQLTNDFSRRPGDYNFYLESDGSCWSVSVPQQSTLAGSYLLTSDGQLHFSTKAKVTINDLVLRALSRAL